MGANNPHQLTYSGAHAAFVERTGNGSRKTFAHPLTGPDGSIAMEAVLWEGADTGRVLVMSSGTHGIEGYCGSFLQCALLDEGLVTEATRAGSLLMVHGVNPWGFAWQRRVNENNVDLNRNFINHDAGHPENPGYRELASILEPDVWAPDSSRRINRLLAKASAAHEDNPRWLQAALSAGQYEFPQGQFYGGTEPQWSNLRIRELAAEWLTGRDVVWIDFHTALGDYGTAQCIVELQPGGAGEARARRLWGERVGNARADTSVSIEVVGPMISGVEATHDRDFLGTGLEFGTVDMTEVGSALIQDQWLRRHGDPDSALGEQTRARMMHTFYPDDPDWRASVLGITREVVDAVLREPR